MKQLIVKLILPWTIISFVSITKWWYATPVDAPNTIYLGFPFPFVGEGWHTSMSLQFFILELLADFLVYFLFWFLMMYCINNYVLAIRTHKLVTIGLWSIAGLLLLGASYIASFPEHLFHFKRHYDLEIRATGYTFTWEHVKRPNEHQ